MKLYGWLGLILLAVSEFFMFRRVEPFYSWFYSFAWWAYILLADNLLLMLRGTSPLSTRRREFLQMLPFSVAIWLAFEAFNFVIRNWAYQGVPAETWLRWPGYALAFATVLPGIFITSEILEWLIYRRREPPHASDHEPVPASSAPPLPRLLGAAGAGLTIAPLVWPRFFFPAVWIGPALLVDPFLDRLGRRSLSNCIADGDRRRVWSLLAGGLTCGLLWEFWNFWAAARWVYSVPFFGRWQVFEMPLLGFLGFPPFAVECWVLYQVLDVIRSRSRSAFTRAVFWSALVVFCGIVFYGIDRKSVLSSFPLGFTR